MRKTTLILLLIVAISNAYSTKFTPDSINSYYLYNNNSQILNNIVTSEDFFKKILKINGKETFKKRGFKISKGNYRHELYEQYFNDIRVEGGGYVLHFKNDSLVSAHGNYIPVKSLRTQPSFTEADAATIFAKYIGINKTKIADYKSSLIVLPTKDSINNCSLRLAYEVSILSAFETGIIDAHTGEIIYTNSVLQDFSSTGTFSTLYSGIQQSKTHYYSGAYHLVDSTRNAVIHTWDLNGNSNLNLKSELSDYDNIWSSNEHSSNNHYIALDIHWGFQIIYDFLYNKYGINSYDDNGGSINAYINYPGSDNAYWDNMNHVYYFTSNYSIFSPLVSLDIIAHEFGHSVSSANNGWGNNSFLATLTSYQRYELEGCNEGLSDVWSVIIESNAKGASGRWQLGEECSKGGKSCLRNIALPSDNNAYTQIADTYNSSFYYNSNDPHVRGGVFSRWFYLLVNGGSGTNAIGNQFSVHGIGIDSAESIIVNAIFEGYLYHAKSFSEIRSALYEYAIDNEDYFFALQIENAWYAVGVGNNPGQISITGPSMICSQDVYTINNIISGASVALNTNNSSTGYSIQVSSNLSIVSYSSGSLTVQKVSDGLGYIKIFYQGNLISTKEMWVGGPIITDLYYDGNYIYSETDYMSQAVDDFYWIINGVTYHWIEGRKQIHLPYGTYNVEAYAYNSCGRGPSKYTQIVVSSGGYYSLGGVSSDHQVTIVPVDYSRAPQPLEVLQAENKANAKALTVPYTLQNAQSGEVSGRGEMPVGGGVLDFSRVRSGLYVLTLTPQGRKPETFKVSFK